jgi:hypothetical protein
MVPPVKSKVKPGLLDGLKLSGFEDERTKQFEIARHLIKSSKCVSLRPLLPILLNLKGDPYSLQNYFPFEPFFRTRLPRQVLLKTGRQVSKSTSLAARGVVQSNSIPHFSTLFVTPLFEMIRRFSQNYVRPFIETSPMSKLFTGKRTGSVLQRTFQNQSQMVFSFAFLDAERTRGIAADKNTYDEVQDLDKDFLPIIRETMSGSKWGGIEEFAGTPKTLENTIEGLWLDSSQGEWMIKCHHMGCGYWNVPAMSHDLDDMIGPYRSDISELNPGVICAKCARALNPRLGRWVHARPERRWQFAGYHVPQIIMPMHYGNHEKWEILLGKRAGRGNTPTHVFYNEVCGESYDTGARLVTVTDLKRAAVLPWRCSIEEGIKNLDSYIMRILAVDWGGGGEKGISFTTMAVLGMLPDGKVDVIWGHKSLTPHDHPREARMCLNALTRFKCAFIAHDYTGAGSLREQFINQSGYPLDRILAIAYVRAASGGILTFKPATPKHPRNHYQADKARSLLLTCNQIKNGWLRFFQYDYQNADEAGLMHDFLALVEEKADSRLGKDIYTIIRDPHLSDDFAQAVNIGCLALYQANDKWPNVAEIEHLRISLDRVDQLSLGAHLGYPVRQIISHELRFPELHGNLVQFARPPGCILKQSPVLLRKRVAHP